MRGRRNATDADGAPRRSAQDKALGLLARREYSQHELRARLARDGYPRDEVDAALASLADANYQDDARFARMLVRSRIGQGYGPQRLRVELKSHGLTDERIGEVLDEADADWAGQARAQLQRRYGTTPPGDYRERARRMQFLARRGFDPATIRAALQIPSHES